MYVAIGISHLLLEFLIFNFGSHGLVYNLIICYKACLPVQSPAQLFQLVVMQCAAHLPTLLGEERCVTTLRRLQNALGILIRHQFASSIKRTPMSDGPKSKVYLLSVLGNNINKAFTSNIGK